MNLRLRCHLCWVDVRLRRVAGVWIASADTPEGPTLGLATRPLPAVYAALECFEELRSELMRDLARTVTG